jgi:hypothetical protein
MDHQEDNILNPEGFFHFGREQKSGKKTSSKSQSGDKMNDTLPSNQKSSRFPAFTFAANYIL